jgi:transcriptional regulator with XRE-family HTH domain
VSVGYRLRELRTQQGRTLADVAGSSGCSRSMLSKVETDHATPSLSTLLAIAKALGVEPGALMCGDASGGTVFEPAGQTAEVPTAKGQRFRAVATARAGKRMQPCLFTADRDSIVAGPLSHDGEQFVLMLEGEMLYRVGLAEYRLRPGDTLYFDARHEHDFSLVSERARWLAVAAAPPPEASAGRKPATRRTRSRSTG